MRASCGSLSLAGLRCVYNFVAVFFFGLAREGGVAASSRDFSADLGDTECVTWLDEVKGSITSLLLLDA